MMQELPPGFVIDTAPSAGPVYGPPPVPKVPDPVDPLIQRKRELEIAKAERDLSKPDGGSAPPSGYRWGPEGNLVPIPGGPADKATGAAAAQATESERTAGFLAGRIKEGVLRFAGAGKEDSAALRPGAGVEAVRTVFGDTAANYFTDDTRQTVRAAEVDILDAALTLGTGAAYTKEQLEGYRQSYFPQLGDGPATIKAKREALRSLLLNAQTKAGRAAPDIEAALAALEALDAQPSGSGEGAIPNEEVVGDLNPEGHGAYGPSGGYMPPDGINNPPGFFDVAKQGVTLGLSDEASGIGQAIGRALTGDFDVVGNYQQGRDTERERIEQARNNMGPVASTLTELVAGAGGVRNAPSSLLSIARGVTAGGQPLTRAAVQSALTQQATRQGAAVGGVGGFGYGEGLEGSAVNSLAGVALGAGVGNVGQRLGNAVSNRSGQGIDRAQANAVANAGAAEGVTINRAMIDPRLENTFSGVEATALGGPRINRAMNEIQDQVEGRVTDLGGGISPGAEAVGSSVQQGASRARNSLRARAGRLYEQADDQAGGVVVQPSQALAEIDNQIAELSASGANSNRGQISYLQDIRQDIQSGMTIRGLRDQRTNLRGQINERSLGQTDAERRVGIVLDAASRDIEAGLANNTGARRLYGEADRLWREQAEYKTQILQDLVGPRNNPKSGEATAKKLESWIKDDAGRFSRLWGSLDEGEQAEIAGMVASNLGRNNKGEFSPAIFLNSISGKNRTVSDKALRIMFGEEGVQSLGNLRTIATELNRLNAKRNSSNTGRVNNYRTWLVDALFGGGIAGSAGLMSGGLGAGSAAALGGAAVGVGVKGGRDILNARMLMNPNITRWIRQAPSTANPRAIDQHMTLLGRIAKAEPALAGDIEVLRRGIAAAANDNSAASVAAEEGDN